jgi:hypothetical protein
MAKDNKVASKPVATKAPEQVNSADKTKTGSTTAQTTTNRK